MERDVELNQYKERLAHQLQSQQRLRAKADCEIFRIFVNHRCVGSLDCEDRPATFSSCFEGQEVNLLEVRTDTGVLVGSLSGLGSRERTCQIRIGDRHSLTLTLKNMGNRGAIEISYRPMNAIRWGWSRIASDSLSQIADFARRTQRGFSELSWAMRISLALQTGLAIGFVYLLMPSSGGNIQKDTGAIEPSHLSSNSQQIARLNREIETLARNQQVLIEKLALYEKSSAQSEAEGERRVEQRLLAKQRKTAHEVAQVRKQLKDLAAAKEALKQDVAVAYGLNRELQEALKQQAEILAMMKSKPSSEGPQSSSRTTTLPPLAQAGTTTEVTEGSRPEELRPLTFWVSFQEGTTEKSVQDLLLQIHGRKIEGPTTTGWINVEAQLKPSETIEGFFETVRKSTIVSAIKTSVTGH